jgi:glycosyl transferase, family 25
MENVVYINLESRADRRIQIEAQLDTLGWKYERFNAIRMKDGRIGCSMSHLKVLMMAKERNWEYVVILEDDAEFKNIPLFNKLLDRFNRTIESPDVLLMAGNIRPPIEKVDSHILRIRKAWSAAAYKVWAHYYDTLIENYREGIKLLMQMPTDHTKYALDSYWMRLQERDKWYILYPRTITQRTSYSDIEKRYVNYDRLMLD